MNRLLKIFSAFIVLALVSCKTETEYTPKQLPKEMGQVIIEGQKTQKEQQEYGEVQQQNQNQNENSENKNKIEQTEEIPEQIEQIEEIEKTKQEKPKTTSFLNRGEAQYWSNLKTVAEIASTFYQNNGSRFTLLSKDGKLYNSSTASYVTTNYFINNGILEESFSDFQCDILLIKGSDIANYIDTDIPLDIDIFTAIKQPSSNKIMISSPKEKIAVISEGNYEKLLKQCRNYHGEITILSPQMAEYERILNFIRVYEGNYDKYYVRDIRMDKKYAVVTFSTQSATNNVKQYILVNEDGFWEVAISNLDTQSNLNYAVNSILTDFNLSLLPPYNIYFYKNDMIADFSEILKNMIFYELIEQQTQVEYICATTNYCYIVLYGGERYLGKKQNDNWDIKKVKSASDAVNSMELDNKNAPTFIVLDE